MERLPPTTAWMTALSVRAVIDALEAAGGQGCARFVGGCVRDTLLGRAEQVADVDIATPLTPPQVIAALKAAGLKAVPTGIEHGTVTAISDGRPHEITTLRRDVETDGRRAVVAFTKSWEEDAQRRDFRLNALYAEPDGVIHDPTGGGLADVAARRIVFVGDPETRIREDYLRILRFFRFLARVGDAAKADPAGLAACAKLRDGITGLSGERVQQEMFKLLASSDPLPAVRLMAEAGVLEQAAPGARNVDRFAGLLQAQTSLGESGDPLLRLAALFPTDDRTAARDAALAVRLSNHDRLRLVAACASWTWPLTPRLSPRELRRAVYEVGTTALSDRLRLAWAADALNADEWQDLIVRAAAWELPHFPATGDEMKALGVPEGPQVGAVRKSLEAWWVDNDFPSDKALVLAELKAIVAGIID